MDESFEEEDGAQYNCELCDFQSGNERRMLRHTLRKHTKSKAIICETCGEEFKINSELNIHIAQRHPSLRVCRFFLEDRCYFVDNCIYKHERRDDVNYVCNICGEKFKMKRDLMFHRKNKHTENLMPCRLFFKDKCMYGDTCWFRHLLVKNKQSKSLDFQEESLKKEKT